MVGVDEKCGKPKMTVGAPPGASPIVRKASEPGPEEAILVIAGAKEEG